MHLLGHLDLPVDGPEIEEDLCIEQCVRFRGLNPLMEGVHPLRGGFTPLRVGGHHVTRAQHLPRAIQSAADKIGERREVITVFAFIVGIIQQQAVVLIGSQTHLLAALGADHDEGIGHRGLPELLLPQNKQATCQGIRRHREQTADLLCGGATVDETCRHLRGRLVGVGQLLHRVLPRQIRREVDGIVAQQTHDVRGGDDAGDPALVHDRQVVDAQLSHEQHGLEGEVLRGGGAGVGGHDGGDRL